MNIKNTVRTMIAEGDSARARAMGVQLKKIGYEVLAVVSDGQALLQLVVSLKPEVVFVGRLKNGMNVQELLKKILENRPTGVVLFADERSTEVSDLDFDLGAGASIGASAKPEEIERAVDSAVSRVRDLTRIRALLARLAETEKRLGEIVQSDSTGRRQAEESARRQASFMQTLLDKIPCPIFYKGVDGLYLGCNTAFETFLGRPKSEILGKTVFDVSIEELARIYHAADAALFNNPGAVQKYETKVQSADGTRRDMQFIKAAYSDETGKTAGLVGVIFDVSERKRLEEQFLHAQKMEAVGRTAGAIAHDFNNFLTGILGNVSLALMEMDVDNPLYRTLEEIIKSSESAVNLTNQLLAFSSKQVADPKTLSLNDTISNLEKLLRRVVGEEVELAINLQDNLGLVRMDPLQVDQILVNLALNARDAMPRGGRLTIETSEVRLDGEYCAGHPTVTQGDYVVLSVSDNGHGMTDEVKSRLFEPFFTTKDKDQGSGLGLATVYGIVMQNRGSIEVKSERGYGTTFRIHLPRVEKGKEPVFGETTAEKLPGGNETVLFVEDEPIVFEFGTRALKKLGYRVIAFSNGGKALLTAKKLPDKIDLLLTDVVMPGMDGRTLADELLTTRQDLKVLFTSAYMENVIAPQPDKITPVNFLHKPYTIQTLARAIREVLDR